MEAWTPSGSLLVSQPDLGKVVELTPNGKGAPRSRVVLAGLNQPQGLAFAKVSGSWKLYVGEADEIDQYQWAGKAVTGRPKVIAPHLPDVDPSGDDDHEVKDVVVARDGTVYFNVGSSSNANPDDRTMTPQRAVIMSVRPDGRGLRLVERGVRNGEGLAIAPNGSVWTAVNERDNIPYPFHRTYDRHKDAFGLVIQRYVNEHPPDEVVQVIAGRDLGWPFCDPDQDLNHPAGSLADIPFVANAATNPAGHRLNCATLMPKIGRAHV